MRDPSAAIVPGDEERLEAELRHHLDLVLRHRALRIRRVVRPALGLLLSP